MHLSKCTQFVWLMLGIILTIIATMIIILYLSDSTHFSSWLQDSMIFIWACIVTVYVSVSFVLIRSIQRKLNIGHIDHKNNQHFILLQIHVVWCVLTILVANFVLGYFPTIIFSFHVLFLAIVIFLMIPTNWFENDRYLSSHCLILFLKIVSFLYFTANCLLLYAAFIWWPLAFIGLLNFVAICISWQTISNGYNYITAQKRKPIGDTGELLIENELGVGVNNINSIRKFTQNLKNKLSKKYNLNSQMLIAIFNSIISIIGTCCVLAWSATQHNGTHPPTPGPTPHKFTTIHGCVEKDYHYWDDKYKHSTGPTSDCTVSIVAIGMGILVIFVIAFGLFMRECCDKKTACDECCCNCNVCCWHLMDQHMRGTIVVKFIYFMLKPMLIYVTQSTSSSNISMKSSYATIANIFELLYQILMFCTVTALAYITFNKKYLLINKMNNIMYNAHLFGKTYIASYLLSIIATYSILIFVCIFTWTGNDGILKFSWYYVIYPQCGWLLFIKLYHNEISQLISALQSRADKNKDYSYRCVEWSTILGNSQTTNQDKNDDEWSNQIIHYYKRLFLYQLAVFLAALYGVAGYLFLLFGGKELTLSVNRSYGDSSLWPWQWMYVWQLAIACAVVMVMPLSMKTAWNADVDFV